MAPNRIAPILFWGGGNAKYNVLRTQVGSGLTRFGKVENYNVLRTQGESALTRFFGGGVAKFYGPKADQS